MKPTALCSEAQRYVNVQPNGQFLTKVKRAILDGQLVPVDEDVAQAEAYAAKLTEQGDFCVIRTITGVAMKEVEINNKRLDHELGVRSLKKGKQADAAAAAAAPPFDRAGVDVSHIKDSDAYIAGWSYQSAADREVVVRLMEDAGSLVVEQDACHMEDGSGGGYLFRSYVKDPNRQAVPALESWEIRNESNVAWNDQQDVLIECYGNDLNFNSENICFLSDQQKGLLGSHSKKFPKAGSATCFKHLEGDAFSLAGSAGVAAFTKVAFATDRKQLANAKESAPDKIKAWLANKPDSAFTKVHGHGVKRDSMASSTVEGMNGADGSAYHGTAIRSHRPGKALQEMVLNSVRRHDARAAKAQACSPALKITPGMTGFLQDRKEETLKI